LDFEVPQLGFSLHLSDLSSIEVSSTSEVTDLQAVSIFSVAGSSQDEESNSKVFDDINYIENEMEESKNVSFSVVDIQKDVETTNETEEGYTNVMMIFIF